jgi:hypothetical protein
MARLTILIVVLSSLAGCGTAPPAGSSSSHNRVDAPSTATAPLVETNIEPGIYAGEVTCDYDSRNTVNGVVEAYTYDFNEVFVISDHGLPNPGVAFNPDNDTVEVFGDIFDVTNRTFDATDSGCVENASLVGTVEGSRVNGLVTWTFIDAGKDAVLYRFDVTWTYRSSGVPWTITEECSGTLTK